MTPLDRLLQVELAPYLAPEVASGCLILITAQTGIGKTHAIKQQILEIILKAITENQPGQTVYYITNSVDNVHQTYQQLLEMIDTQEINGKPRFSAQEKQQLKSKIVYLPSQNKQLLEADSASIDQIIHLFSLQSDQRLIKGWQKILKLQQLIREQPQAKFALQESLNEQASETYRLLISLIQHRQRSQNSVNLSADDLALIDQLIPGDRLARQQAHIAFMTTHKFLAGYQTNRYRAHPLREKSNALLLVDEFDRQNEIILQVMVEQKSLDLIEFTCTLHDKLKEHQLENSPRYKGIEDLLEPLRQELAELVARWSLQYAFNTDGEGMDAEKIRLFSDRTVTHVHSSTHRLHLATNKELRKNIIKAQEQNTAAESGSTDKHLSRFVNEADRMLQHFIWTMRKAVWLYLKNHHNHHPGDTQRAPTIQEAVHSILRHFHLQELSPVVLAAFDAQVSFRGLREQGGDTHHRSASRTYHDKGFKLTDIRRNESTSDTVSCYYTGLMVTPSGLLARLVESGIKLVGISATATANTVIKNFDLHYLKTRLGSQFVTLSGKQKASIGDWYRSCRQYDQAGVQIKAEFINDEQERLQQALEAYHNGPVRKPLVAIENLLNINDSSNDHPLLWCGKLLGVLRRFMQVDNSRYLLVLLNRTISRTKQPLFIAFLEHELQRHSADTGHGYQLFCGMNADALHQGKFDQVLNHLSNTSDKVIVLSTYASMGEGKNPDYPVQSKQDKAQLIWVGAGSPPTEIRTDIDTLYLEKPSYQLLLNEDYQINQLLLCHQIMALQESGALAPANARQWLKELLKGLDKHLNLKKYYATNDYPWLVRKIVEQAVGRTARTAFKRPVIRLYADIELQKLLLDDERPATNLSHEYLALRNAAADFSFGVASSNNDEQQKLCNRAALCTADTLSLIRELMSGFRGTAPDSAISSWENLRKQLLTHPTTAAAVSDYPRLYIQVPTPTGYRFSGGLEVTYEHLESGQDMWFFEQAHGSRWISEETSGLLLLMKNPVVRQYFANQGYALAWQQNPFMMNPAAFFNLYKGALGEEAIAAILAHAGLRIEPLPQQHYELCDFLIRPFADQPPIAIDAKHWQSPGEVDNHQEKAKVLRSDQNLNIRQFAYINLFGKPEQPCRYLDVNLEPCNHSNSSVIEVPGLIDPDTGEILQHKLTAFLEWMGE